MSVRVVRYEGEGRHRRPVYADEGPSSAAARDPIAIHANGGLPHLAVPTGGAGPIERRLISEAERQVRADMARRGALFESLVAEARAKQSPNGVSAMPAPEPDPVVEPATPNTRLRALADAAMTAATAWTAREIAIEAWRTAQADLEAAIAAVSGPVTPTPPADPEPTLVDQYEAVRASLADHAESSEAAIAPAPVKPTAEGGRATAEQLQRSRRNGQAAMQRVKREKGVLGAQQQRILDAVVRHGGDRKAAAAEIGVSDGNIAATLRNIGEKGLLPIDLIPKLPAAFAKYTGV